MARVVVSPYAIADQDDIQTNGTKTRALHRAVVGAYPCSAAHMARSRSAVQMRGVSMPWASS